MPVSEGPRPPHHNYSLTAACDESNGDVELHSVTTNNPATSHRAMANCSGGGMPEADGVRTAAPTEHGAETASPLKVYYTDTDLRTRTKLEKSLMALCALLFCTCVAFVIITISRNSKEKYCLTEHCVKTAAKLLEAIDPEADPCEDFYQYACGTWNKKYLIPDDKSSYNTFEKLQDELLGKLRKLLEEGPNEYDTNSTLKAKTLYSSCINTSQVEEVGDRPLRQVLASLGDWPVVTANWSSQGWVLEDTVAKMRGTYNAPIFIDSWVAADDKNSSVHILQLDQTSLGMPSREYYIKGQEAKDSKYKEAYLNYMIKIAMLLGANETHATREMKEVLEFEIQLANVTTPQSERHDTGAMYTKLRVQDLQDQVHGIDWLKYFNGFMPSKIKSDEFIVSFAMEYLRNLSKLLEKQKPRVLANYLLWRLIMGLAPEMTVKYQVERNEYRKVLQGISRDKVRWQKCVEYVNDRMGMAVGRMFIRDNFPKHSKDVALEMIHNIREAFNEILVNSDWMDEETKAVAKEKAYAMNERIGYPEFILDKDQLDKKYGGLTFEADQYFENILRVERHDSLRNLKKLREPVPRDEWDQDPAVVNAFYNPNTNDIVFPAAILQPLFYDEHFPKSLNYGGIGVVIGHEITHGFDDKGRQYDKDGNLRQWWNNQTIEAFRKRAQCMIDQYNTYVLQPFGYKIDGRNTQGENIADNGGLKESFRAYRKWVERNGEEQPLPGIDLSHNQLFFLNYAQIWCGIMRGEEALHKIRTSVHSPGPIRVLGPLSNSKDFAEAYSCPLGSRMNPVKKCAVW